MRIHLTGTNWHAATTANLKKAFEVLGHEVSFFDKHLSRNWKIAQNIALRLKRRPHEAENYFYKKTSERWLESLNSFKPDLIIIEDAPNILADYIRRAREFCKPIFYYEISPPQGAGARDVLLSFRYVDEVFCIDRDWAPYINHFFDKKVRVLPLAANPDDFYPMPEEKKIYDLAYVASVPEQTPDGLLRANLINAIPDKYKVAVAGNGWRYWLKYFPKLKNRIVSSGAVSTAEVNRLYNQSEIALNFHSTMHSASISPRIFEAGLVGIFQITDFRADLDTLGIKKHLALFTNPRDLVKSLEEWLPKKKERREMTHELRKVVLEKHIWKHRAEEILICVHTKKAI